MPKADQADRLHHLSRDRRGRWTIRLTLDQGNKVTGRPIRIHLGKCTEEDAIRHRDLQIATLKKAGVKLILRKQKREST